MNDEMRALLQASLRVPLDLKENFATLVDTSGDENQQQTNEVFTEKWDRYAKEGGSLEAFYAFQREWYLKLYGFADERALAGHLASSKVILDAGCGLGYKAAWFAKLAPHALVVGMDFSAAAQQAAETFADVDNLVFLRGDIADTPFGDGAVGYVSCDQVIMHTEEPEETFAELARITAPAGDFACYFYAKKALPRELLDDYFRVHCKELSSEELWAMSEQLTELGRRLTELSVEIDVPAIPALGIKGGPMDIQRFIYWNFLKCFWNEELGRETSLVTNFDWYSPSNARRFSEAEVRAIVASVDMEAVFFHSEEAAHSGRFAHRG